MATLLDTFYYDVELRDSASAKLNKLEQDLQTFIKRKRYVQFDVSKNYLEKSINQVLKGLNTNTTIKLKAKIEGATIKASAIQNELNNYKFKIKITDVDTQGLRTITQQVQQAIENASRNVRVTPSGGGGSIVESLGGSSHQWQNLASSIYTVRNAFEMLSNVVEHTMGKTVEFQQSFSNLAAILQSSKADIFRLEDNALKLGRATNYTASEVLNLETELAKLGYSQNEILDATDPVLKFAQAVGTDLPNAASVAGSAIRAFNADAKETKDYVASMAIATTKSAMRFQDMETMIGTVAPVASQFGLTIQDLLALTMKLRDAGMNTSTAVTSLRNIFLNLSNSESKLSMLTKANVHDFDSFIEMLKKMRDLQKEIGDTEFLAATGVAAGKRGVTAFNNLVQNVEDLRNARDSVTDVGDALDTMAGTQTDNAASAILRLKSAWEGWLLTLRGTDSLLNGVISAIAKGLNIIEPLAPYLLGIATVVGTLAGVFAVATTATTAWNFAMNILKGTTLAFGVTASAALGWITAIGAVLGVAIGAYYSYNSAVDEATDNLRKFSDEASNAVNKLNTLVGQIKAFGKDSAEGAAAMDDLVKMCKRYNIELDAENASIEQVNAAREKAIDLIYAEADAKLIAAQREKAANDYNDKRNESVKDYTGRINSGNPYLSGAVASGVANELERNTDLLKKYVDAQNAAWEAYNNGEKSQAKFAESIKYRDQLLEKSIKLIKETITNEKEQELAIYTLKEGFADFAKDMYKSISAYQSLDKQLLIAGARMDDFKEKEAKLAHEAVMARGTVDDLQNSFAALLRYQQTDLHINVHVNMDGMMPSITKMSSADALSKARKVGKEAVNLANELANYPTKAAEIITNAYTGAQQTKKDYLAFLNTYGSELATQGARNYTPYNAGSGRHINLSKPKKTGRKTDPQAEARRREEQWNRDVQSEINSIKKARETYQKALNSGYGSKAAIKEVKEGGFSFSSLLGDDVVNDKTLNDWYKANIKKIIEKIKAAKNSPKRQEMIDALSLEMKELEFDDLKRTYSAITKQITTSLNEEAKAWQNYLKIVEKTGDARLAAALAYRDKEPQEWYLEKRRSEQINEEAMNMGLSSGAYKMPSWVKSLDDLLNETRNDERYLQRNGLEYLKPYLDEYQKAKEDEAKEDIQYLLDLLTTGIGKLKSDFAEIDFVRDNTIRAIESSKMSDDEKRNATSKAYARADYQKILASGDLERLISNPLIHTRKSFDTLAQVLQKRLNKALERGAITAKEYTDAMNKISDAMAKNKFGNTLVGKATMSKRDRLVNERDKAADELKEAQDNNDLDIIPEKEAQLAELNEAIANLDVTTMTVEGINQLCQGLKSLADNIREVQEALGTDTRGSEVYATIDALAAASSSLSEGVKSGSITGIIAGFVGMVTKPIAIFARNHDEKLTKQIELLERSNKELELMNNEIKNNRERTLGHDVNGKYGNSYNTERDNLKKQWENTIKQREAEQKKKDSDADAILDYKTQEAELLNNILNYSFELAQELYGIDLKGWANQFGDALVQAWEKGTSAADAFATTAKSILTDVANKWISESILQPKMQALQEYLFGNEEGGFQNGVWSSDNTLDKSDMKGVVKHLYDINSGIEESNKLLDDLDAMYYAEYGKHLKDENMQSLGNTISQITESTADLLAAYLNEIRQDVHGIYTNSNPILNNQLAQLRSIAEYTERNAIAAEDIQRTLNDVVNGTKQINVA